MSQPSDRPNELLNTIREYVDTIVRGEAAGRGHRCGPAYGRDEIVAAFAELDSLLSAGGIYPDPWRRVAPASPLGHSLQQAFPDAERRKEMRWCIAYIAAPDGDLRTLVDALTQTLTEA